MKESNKYTLADYLYIAVVLIITFTLGAFSDDPVRFYATCSVVVCVTTNYRLQKHLDSLEEE